jgi:hypothetical protein
MKTLEEHFSDFFNKAVRERKGFCLRLRGYDATRIVLQGMYGPPEDDSHDGCRWTKNQLGDKYVELIRDQEGIVHLHAGPEFFHCPDFDFLLPYAFEPAAARA